MPLSKGPRPNRKGKGLLPPNPKQWEAEHLGLDVRGALAIPLVEPLPVFDLFLQLEKVSVRPLGEIPAAQMFVDHLRNDGARRWSGMAVPILDHCLVVYNDAHPETRVRATLMEEFFHLWIGQPPSIIRIHDGRPHERTRDNAAEDLAFAAGAACLVPYKALKQLVADGVSVAEIARTFGVSMSLISFRMKVTKLYRNGGRTRHSLAPQEPILPPPVETSD